MPTQHIATLLGATCCVPFGHRVATCCDVLGVVGSNLTIFKLEPTTPNMSQHIATHRNTVAKAHNMLRPTMLGYVVLACCDRLAGAFNSLVTLGLRWQSHRELNILTCGRCSFLPKEGVLTIFY